MKVLFQSGGIVFALLAMLILPLVVLDLGLIWLLEEQMPAPLILFLALSCFYGMSFGLGFLIDGLVAVLSSVRTASLSFWRAVGHLATSAGSLYGVTWMFSDIVLSPLTMAAIVFLHWIGAHLWLRNESADQSKPEPSDALDHHIVHLLRTATVPDCVKMMQQQYPDVPKLELLHRVRRLSR